MRTVLVLMVAATLAGAEGDARHVDAKTAAGPLPSERNPASELLEADRAFAAAARTRDLLSGVGAIFADNAVMPTPGRGFADGRAAILAALARDTLNATSRAHWTPVRAGASADGTHGVTIGFFEVTRADGTVLPGKYLAYWVQGAEGWRVAVWRRTPRPPGEVSLALAPSWSHAQHVSAPASLDAARAELQAAEQAFSDEAQRIGLGPAFAAFGADDAMHLGGPADVDFVRGRAAIARAVGEGLPPGTSPVTWNAERTIIAPSGDLGVNLGYIRSKSTGADGRERPPFPFFTVWRKDAVGWRYIAE